MDKAARTYVLEFGGAMAAYVVVLVASVLLLQNNADAPWRVPLALVPVVPTIFALAAFLHFLRQMDEMQRRIQLEGIGLSFGATAILTFAYGFLEHVGFPQVSLIWILPLMVMLWGLGVALAAQRYQ
ncbi:MAG TPA: hypothetical protein VGP82_12230 [Ktedonobacterales bacterium]|jgi:hypothetical protein|nr:hypothetical protein [Ktedonobacterales bacterium]